MQLASSDQVLGVEIAHFENMYNSEVRFGNYCCCDEPDSPCVETLETLQKCPIACDPFFNVHFQQCQPYKNCSILSKSFFFSFDSTSEVSPLLVQIPFNQSDLELYNQVRICIAK